MENNTSHPEKTLLTDAKSKLEDKIKRQLSPIIFNTALESGRNADLNTMSSNELSDFISKTILDLITNSQDNIKLIINTGRADQQEK